jgi:hypothetical protein
MADGQTIGKLRLPLPPGEQKSQELGTFSTRLTVLVLSGITLRKPTGKRVCPCHPALRFPG